jgi:hypothetical protein
MRAPAGSRCGSVRLGRRISASGCDGQRSEYPGPGRKAHEHEGAPTDDGAERSDAERQQQVFIQAILLSLETRLYATESVTHVPHDPFEHSYARFQIRASSDTI